MKKAEYVVNPFAYLLGLCFPFGISCILLICGEFYPALVCFFIAIVYLIPIIIFKKSIFSKMLINENGIKVLFRKKVIKQIKWNEIKDAIIIETSHGGRIMFSETPLHTGKDKWKNKNKISIDFNSKLIKEYLKYKDKVAVPIKDFYLVPEEYKIMFF